MPSRSRNIYIKIGNSQLALLKASKKVIELPVKDISKSALSGHLRSGDRLWVASVVPKASSRLRRNSKSLSCEFKEIRASQLSIQAAYPKTLGLDRTLNIYSCCKFLQVRRPFVIIDMGSAITVDFVQQNGKHLGGWICAGPRLALEALHQKTALLPLVKMGHVQQKKKFGRTTKDCLEIGQIQTLYGLCQRAEEVGLRVLKKKPKIVLTGGWSAYVQLPRIIKMKHLALQGMKYFVEHSGVIS